MSAAHHSAVDKKPVIPRLPWGIGLLPRAWVRTAGLIRWTVATVYAIAPRLTIGLIVVSIVGGLTPLAMMLVMRELINHQLRAATGQSGDLQSLTPLLSLLFATALAEAFVSLARSLLRGLLQERANRDLSAAVMEAAARQPVAFFEQHKSLDMLERLQGQVATRLVDLIGQFLGVFMSAIQVVTLVGFLAAIEPFMGLLAVPLFLPYLWFQLALSRGVFSDHQEQAGTRRRIAYALNMLTSARYAAEVRLLGIAPHIVAQFRMLMRQVGNDAARRHWQGFFGSMLFAILSLTLFLAMFAKVALAAVRGSASVGDVVFFAAAVLRLRNSLEQITHAVAAGLAQTRYVEALRSFLELPCPEELGGSVPLPVPFSPEICCEGVSFTYPGAKTPSLSNLSLEIKPGETIAIVGENGSGKTTLVKLLAGFYAPSAGSIRVSGHDIQELSLPELRRQISFVFQEYGRYAASVAENIAYGDWPALEHDRKAIEHCAVRAHLAGSVARMPEGYDTLLGRQFGDYEPSGGVWQKIAIARAFAREASILILDEPTANVDARAEYELFRQLASLAEGRTTILISHRFSTVSMAQRILVMQRGRIVEQGSHAELLALGGHYAQLYSYHQRQLAGD